MSEMPNILVALGVVGILVMMIIPLPAFILDLLLVLNMSLGVMVLLLTMYTQRVLDFAIFPTVLLMSTMFRLALNVSSTRLILLQGKSFDGAVIKAFGNFVVGGNYVVGFVIFIILVIIQFMVITKGAERIAEVQARFALDSMPGKQMAIEAELNAGSIDQETATSKRKDLQREMDFFGAMDGASKFVKGDAIAGIVITIINILGGILIGSLSGEYEGVLDVMATYSLLTIGDGLVSQVPALLVATATGILVTRSASENELGRDLGEQLADPRALFIAATILLAFGIVPGLPMIPFWIMATFFAFLGYSLSHELAFLKFLPGKDEAEAEEEAVEESDEPQTEDLSNLLGEEPMELEIGFGLVPLADPEQGGDLLNRVTMIKRQMALEMGIIVPSIRIRDNMQLDQNQYVFKLKGTSIAVGELLIDHFLAMDPGTVAEKLDGIETIEPAFGLPAIWVPEIKRERAEALGYIVVDPPSVLATHLTEIIKRYAHEIMGRQEVQFIIDKYRNEFPAVVEEVLASPIKLGGLQKILKNLVKEQVSIKNMVSILESVADCISMNIMDIETISETVREAIGRNICNQYVKEGVLYVLTLDPELERSIQGSIFSAGPGSAPQCVLEPQLANVLFNKLIENAEKITAEGYQMIIITSRAVRKHLKTLTSRALPNLVVLSFNEVPEELDMQSIGTISVS